MRFRKEYLIVFFILLFIISVELVTYIFSERTVGLIEEKTEAIILKMKQANKNDNISDDEINKDIGMLKETWINKQDKLSKYVEHDELEKATNTLIILEENASNGEYTQALANGKEFEYWLEHFKEKSKLLIKNIL